MSNANEPAFPRNYDHIGHNGLTKREYFAAMAMQGILSGCDNDTALKDSFIRAVAEESVTMADALIEALNKKGGEDDL